MKPLANKVLSCAASLALICGLSMHSFTMAFASGEKPGQNAKVEQVSLASNGDDKEAQDEVQPAKATDDSDQTAEAKADSKAEESAAEDAAVDESKAEAEVEADKTADEAVSADSVGDEFEASTFDADSNDVEQAAESKTAPSSSQAEDAASKDAASEAKKTAKASGAVKTADELKAALEDDSISEITLSEDIVVDDALTVDRAVTISGASISRSDRTKSVFDVSADGDLTLKDIAVKEGSTFVANKAYSYMTAISCSGKLSLLGGATVSNFTAAEGAAVTLEKGADLLIDGAQIAGNKACNNRGFPRAGAVLLKPESKAAMQSGTLSSNEANNNSRSYGGVGGAVYVSEFSTFVLKGGTVSGNLAGFEVDNYYGDGCSVALGGGFYVDVDSHFRMEGGTVSNNKALGNPGHSGGLGGGICVAGKTADKDTAPDIYLMAGEISGNIGLAAGGGVYVDAGTEAHIPNAAIVHNEATYNNAYGGGGLFLCTAHGEVVDYATDNSIITDNKADRRGDDVLSENDSWEGGAKTKSSLAERNNQGVKIAWYEDCRDARYAEAENPQPIAYFAKWVADKFLEPDGDIALHSVADYDLADYPLVIKDNNSQAGGGVGCNGLVYLSESPDMELSIVKKWKDINGEDESAEAVAKHEPIAVDVFNGDVKIDTVTLSADNEWKETLTGLPSDGAYKVKEASKIEGYKSEASEPEKDEDGNWSVTVTNSVPSVSVSVEKKWQEAPETAEPVEHDPVAVDVFNGEEKVGTVALNADNEWKAELKNLPVDGEYTVKEATQVDGYHATISEPVKDDDGNWSFTVTNIAEEEGGEDVTPPEYDEGGGDDEPTPNNGESQENEEVVIPNNESSQDEAPGEADEQQDDGEDNNEGEESTNAPRATATSTAKATTVSNAVNAASHSVTTGDGAIIGFVMLGAAAVIALGVVIVVKRNRRRNNKS